MNIQKLKVSRIELKRLMKQFDNENYNEEYLRINIVKDSDVWEIK